MKGLRVATGLAFVALVRIVAIQFVREWDWRRMDLEQAALDR